MQGRRRQRPVRNDDCQSAPDGPRRRLRPGAGFSGRGECQRGCLAEIWGRAGQRVPPPLVPGDVVTLEVGGIGLVSNKIVDPAPAPEIPKARRGQPRGPRR